MTRFSPAFDTKLLCILFLKVVLTDDVDVPDSPVCLHTSQENPSLVSNFMALSRPSRDPDIPQFIAMTLLNGIVIDYYDSKIKKKVPRQRWMDEEVDAEYLKSGTGNLQKKQKWFNVTINDQMKRREQNDSDIHILRWQHGCEGKKKNKALTIESKPINMLNYDGMHMSFNTTTKSWVPSSAAFDTKDHWSGIQIPADNRGANPLGDCMFLLETFYRRQEEYLKTAPQPELYMFAKKTKDETKVILTCLATGFHLKNIPMHIRRDGRDLNHVDGLVTSCILPNGDNTFQRRDSIEILTTDTSIFTCKVSNMETVWDHKVPVKFQPIYFLLLLLPLSVVLVAVLVYKRTKCRIFSKTPVDEAAATGETHELDHLNRRTSNPDMTTGHGPVDIPSSNQEPFQSGQISQWDSGIDFNSSFIIMGNEDDSDDSDDTGLSGVWTTRGDEFDAVSIGGQTS